MKVKILKMQSIAGLPASVDLVGMEFKVIKEWICTDKRIKTKLYSLDLSMFGIKKPVLFDDTEVEIVE